MKKTLLLFCIGALLFSACGPNTGDPAADPARREIEQFKSLTGIRFRGKVFNQDVVWQFKNWEGSIGTSAGSFWCVVDDKRIQNRNSSIYDHAKQKDLYMITIESPAFSIDSSYAFKKAIFAPGTKKIRRSTDNPYAGFVVQAYSQTNCFSTLDGDQSRSTFEVVRLEEMPPVEGMRDFKKIKVWMVVNCSLYHCGGVKAGEIKNGLFCLDFEVDRNE